MTVPSADAIDRTIRPSRIKLVPIQKSQRLTCLLHLLTHQNRRSGAVVAVLVEDSPALLFKIT